MNILQRVLVWISRMGHCRGFGIQSPTDYQFVRHVVNEHWPYYAYAWLGKDDYWLTRKLGLLYFRLANWRQPAVIVDGVGAGSYLQAGCRRAQLARQLTGGTVELALLPVEARCQALLDHCDRSSVIVVEGIYRNWAAWHELEADERVGTTFDLYYCGIIFCDIERFKHHYIINF